MAKKIFFPFFLVLFSLNIFSFQRIHLLNDLSFFYFPSDRSEESLVLLFKMGTLSDDEFKSGVAEVSSLAFKTELEKALKSVSEKISVSLKQSENFIVFRIYFDRKEKENVFFIVKSTLYNFNLNISILNSVKEKISLKILNSMDDNFLRLDYLCRRNLFLCDSCGFLRNFKVINNITKFDVYSFLKRFLNPSNISIFYRGEIKNIKPYIFVSKYFGCLIKRERKKISFIKRLNRRKRIVLKLNKNPMSLVYFEVPPIFDDDYIFSVVFEKGLLKEFREKFSVLKVERIEVCDSAILEIFLKRNKIEEIFNFIKNFNMDKALLQSSKEIVKREMENISKDEFDFLIFCEERGITPFIFKNIKNYINTVEMEDIKYIKNKYFSEKNINYITTISEENKGVLKNEGK